MNFEKAVEKYGFIEKNFRIFNRKNKYGEINIVNPERFKRENYYDVAFNQLSKKSFKVEIRNVYDDYPNEPVIVYGDSIENVIKKANDILKSYDKALLTFII